MSTIRRRASYRIITRAVQQVDEPLAGVLPAGADDYQPCTDRDQLQAALQQQVGAMVVYNQHPAARALVDALEYDSDQVFLEIRQDTKGVLGLHALHRGEDGDETLELVYQ